MTPTERSFIEHFGRKQANRITRAAESRKNGVHDNPGSDKFRWAIAICIGYQCMEKQRFRKFHGIAVPWKDLQNWIREHADLANHDGDVDYISLLIGAYGEYVKSEPEQEHTL